MSEVIQQSRFKKPIVFSARVIPNFLWHMLAVAKIGYDSDYADRFDNTVDGESRQLLEQHKSLLKFGEGEGGALSAFFAMFPAWLPLADRGDLAAYIEALNQVLRTRSLRPFTEAFSHANWRDRFISFDLAHFEFPDNAVELGEIAQELGQSYVRNFDTYAGEVWSKALSALQGRGTELTAHFSKRDYIAEWEQLLGLTFEADKYDITLCFANKNGPDYNSLGYDGNLIYFGKPFDRTCQFISHEIGTHLMIDTLLKLRQEPNMDFRKIYAAYETLAMFFNRRVLGVSELAYRIPQFDDHRQLEKYERIYLPGMTPEEMIRRVVC